MNKQIELVEKWVADNDSVSQLELEANVADAYANVAAYADATYAAANAATYAAAYAAAADTYDAANADAAYAYAAAYAAAHAAAAHAADAHAADDAGRSTIVDLVAIAHKAITHG
jgi:hypothetical protein